MNILVPRALVRLWPLALAMLLAPSAAQANKVANKLKGKIILSPKAFPSSFASDKAFIKHMRRADTKRFTYGESQKIGVEFMAFFARKYTVTEFTVTIFDITERREMVTTFPVYPQQRETRILASFVRLEPDAFQEEHRFLMVVQPTYGGPVIAETQFAIKAGKRGKKKAPAKP